MARTKKFTIDGQTESTILEPDYGETLAQWEYDEHESHKRSFFWYLLSGVGILAVLAYAFFNENPLLAVIMILAVVVFAIGEYRGATRRTLSVMEDGILAGTVFYPYADLENFFIIYQPPRVKMLYFNPSSMFKPTVGIHLEDQDPNIIRGLLLTYLPEDLEKEDEPMSEFIGRLFKF